jgi:flagellar biogenesis protein FliO
MISKKAGPWLSNLLSGGLCLAGGIWIWRGRLREQSAVNGELWSVISTRPLDSRHRLMVVRFADSLLLLSVSQNQVSLLKEIDDPAQVAQVNAHVSGQQQSPARSLRQQLAALGVLRGVA